MQAKWMLNPKKTTLHAELHAIVVASRVLDEDQFNHSSIYVVRVKKDGHNGKWIYGLAKPCEGCLRCITAFGIRELRFSTDDGEIAHIKLR